MAMKPTQCERRTKDRRSRWLVPFRQTLWATCLTTTIAGTNASEPFAVPPELVKPPTSPTPFLKTVGIKFVATESPSPIAMPNHSAASTVIPSQEKSQDKSDVIFHSAPLGKVPSPSMGVTADVKLPPLVAKGESTLSSDTTKLPPSVKIELRPTVPSSQTPTKLTISPSNKVDALPVTTDRSTFKSPSANIAQTEPIIANPNQAQKGVPSSKDETKVASIQDRVPSAQVTRDVNVSTPSNSKGADNAGLSSIAQQPQAVADSTKLLPPPAFGVDIPTSSLTMPEAAPTATFSYAGSVKSGPSSDTSSLGLLPPTQVPIDPPKTSAASTPQVVRIPSMTLSNPNKLALSVVAEQPKAPTPSVEMKSSQTPVPTAIAMDPMPQASKEASPNFDVNPSTRPHAVAENSEPRNVRLESLPSTTLASNQPLILDGRPVPSTQEASDIQARTATSNTSMSSSPVIRAIPVSLDRSAMKSVIANEHQQDTSPQRSRTVMEPPIASSSPVIASPIDTPQPHPSVKQLEVFNRNVRTVDFGRPISRVEIDDEDVCKSVATESTSFILLGLTKGIAKVTVWPDAGEGREGPAEEFEVTVRDKWNAAESESQMENAVNKAVQSLEEMFPTAAIVFKPQANGSLLVGGRASTNTEAKQIVQLVRKMFLVPVIDRVAVASP